MVPVTAGTNSCSTVKSATFALKVRAGSTCGVNVLAYSKVVAAGKESCGTIK